MLHTLYARLALALVGLFLLVGCLFSLVLAYSMEMFQQEVSQKLNRGVAQYVVDHYDLRLDGEAAQASVNSLFESLMVVNPDVEVYLLDPAGNLLAWSAAPGVVRREHVDVAPIRRFIDSDRLPVFGDDPRQPDGEKIFSAAPVMRDGRLAGYLYVIAGGERHDSIAAMIRGSYVLELSAWGLGAGIVFAALAGLLVFGLLTRRLRRLSAAVERFERDGRVEPGLLPAPPRDSGDEIDRLGAAFRDMAERVAARMGDLEQADRLRRELVANVSHDLRTPLASLQGYLDTVLMKQGQLDEAERQRYLEIAARHAGRLGGLISELFELAYLDANDRPPECEPFSLSDLPFIFERFYQPASRRREGEEDGVGLGLAIARRILELHGSRIEAESEPRRGTTFTFDLPMHGLDGARGATGAA